MFLRQIDFREEKMIPRNRRTDLIFRVKTIIKKCRERGKWDLVSRLAYKYGIVVAGKKYYD